VYGYKAAVTSRGAASVEGAVPHASEVAG